jgi:hypothetical protein
LVAILGLSPQQALNAAMHHAVASTMLSMFNTESAAQKHSPRDEAVWLNIPSGIHHRERYALVRPHEARRVSIRKEADAAGDRDTRNGQ